MKIAQMSQKCRKRLHDEDRLSVVQEVCKRWSLAAWHACCVLSAMLNTVPCSKRHRQCSLHVPGEHSALIDRAVQGYEQTLLRDSIPGWEKDPGLSALIMCSQWLQPKPGGSLLYLNIKARISNFTNKFCQVSYSEVRMTCCLH